MFFSLLAALQLAFAADPVLPEQSLFLPSAEPEIPHPGQEHPQGLLGRSSHVMWIPMWTQKDPHRVEILSRTVPVSWPAGGGRAVIQIYHRARPGKQLLTVNVTTPDGVQTHKVTARPIDDELRGGVQTVVVPFETSKDGKVSVEVVADGLRRVHLGTIQLAKKEPRPIYVMEHCVNSVRQIRKAIKDGANAAEVDLMWVRGQLIVKHPAPRPKGCIGTYSTQDRVATFFAELGEAMRGDDAPFALVSMDVKGPELNTDAYASALAKAMIAGGIPPEKTMLMAGHKDTLKFADALARFGFKIGFIDGMHDMIDGPLPYDWVEQSVKGGSNFLGVGRDPMIFWAPMPKYAGSLKQVIDARGAGGPPYHAYFWTVERRASFRFAMGLGLDGVIANEPKYLMRELKKAPYKDLYVVARKPPKLPPPPPPPPTPEEEKAADAAEKEKEK